MSKFQEVSERAKAQMLANQQHKASTMESVKLSLINGDLESASSSASSLYGMDKDEETKLRDIFYIHSPKPTLCPDCGNKVPWEVNYHFNYFQYKCQSCVFVEIMTEKVRKTPELMRICGVPGRYHNASMDDFSGNYHAIDTKHGYFFHGTPGTGKTHLLSAIFKKTILDMKPESYTPDGNPPRRHAIYSDFSYPAPYSRDDFPVFVSAPELLVSIKSTFGHHDSTTEKDIIDKYSGTSVLFLDDLGAEYSTEWAVGVMFLLIDRRYNAKLVTHITSNFNLDELSSRLNDRITSRIAGMCKVVKLTGKDRRF